MKVLLINPPGLRRGRLSRGLMGGYGMRVGQALVYPPIQLAYVAAVLERDGHQVAIHDAEALGETPATTLEYAAASSADMVAMPCSQDGFDDELALSRQIRSTGARVCLFGPMAFNHRDRCFDDGEADWVVVGEPDLAVARLVAEIEAGGPESTPGIAYASGAVAANGEAERVAEGDGSRVADLDALPFPARHRLAHRLYRYPGDRRPMTTLHASRGCPIDCPFCAYVFTEGRKLRSRGAESIIAEIEHAHREHDVELFVFRDPIFTLDRRRVEAMCAELRRLALGVEWICETALRFLDDELLTEMRAAGCTGVSFGVESANDELQAKYGKGKIGSRRHAVEVVRACRRLGIRTRAFFMLGFPEETAAMRRETVDFALELDPDTVQFVPVTVYPGTPLHREHGDSPHPGGVLDPAAWRSVRRAYRRFYGRPSRLLQELRAPGALLRKTGRYLALQRG